jgi:hypothetical protein
MIFAGNPLLEAEFVGSARREAVFVCYCFEFEACA